MGGHPYWYFVPYRDDLQGALDDLRARELAAGRYNPVIRILRGFGTEAFFAQAPGGQHATAAAAMQAADAEGTRSILDISKIARTRADCRAAPLSADALRALFGTDRPTHAMAEKSHDFLDDIERGQCVYFFLYDGGKPVEICFAGYSFD